MTVYVWRCYEKPKVRHLPANPERGWVYSLCGYSVFTAEEHAAHRRRVVMHPERLKPIDYVAIPLCKLCEKAGQL